MRSDNAGQEMISADTTLPVPINYVLSPNMKDILSLIDVNKSYNIDCFYCKMMLIIINHYC